MHSGSPSSDGAVRLAGTFGGRVVSNAAWLAMCSALGAIAIVGLIFPHVPLPLLIGLVPAMLVVTSFSDCATGFVLVAMWRPLPSERAILVLAAWFLSSGALAFALFAILPMWPWGNELLRFNAQAASWLYVFWHFGAAVAGLIYAAFRRSKSELGPAPKRFIAAVVVVAVAYVVTSIVVAVRFGEQLPHLISGTSLAMMWTNGTAMSIIVCCAIAGLRVAMIRPFADIDRALAIALIAVGVGLALVVGGGGRTMLTWYLGRLAFCLSSVFVLVTAIATLVRSRSALVETEAALDRSRDESAMRAQRLRTLWELADDAVASERDRVRAILELATATLRPNGASTCGFLSHVEGGTLVIDEIAFAGAEQHIAALLMQPGASLALERTIFGHPGITSLGRAFNDLKLVEADGLICSELGWRSLIFAPLQIERRTYFLTFALTDEMTSEPFAEDDIAYVDVLASFIARRFSERQQLERIQYQVEHDALTGLKNRAQFRSAVRNATMSAAPFAVAYLDIDDFRRVNEANGHMVCDELLVEVAVELSSVDERDFIARLGGDEFAIVMHGVGAPTDVHDRLGAYASLFKTPFHTGDRDGTRRVSLSASLGAALFPRDGRTVDDLVRAADVALAAAKSRGGGAIMLFDTHMVARVESAQLKSRELADAIANGGLMLAYQPTFELGTRRITGAEALVRWNHPVHGEIQPDEFIEFAERNGLIGRLSRWVMQRVISDLAQLPSLPPGFRCFFNLATAQIDDLAFIGELEARLRSVPRVADHLGIEITETAAIHNTENTIYALDRFRRLGLRIAIDDFGTGYSSLSYLKRLPVDMIKIDRSFINGLPSDAKDVALCEVLLQISDRFDLTVLAEGIETEEQLRWLIDHGCCFGQGYLVSRPAPFAALAASLAQPHPLLVNPSGAPTRA